MLSEIVGVKWKSWSAISAMYVFVKKKKKLCKMYPKTMSYTVKTFDLPFLIHWDLLSIQQKVYCTAFVTDIALSTIFFENDILFSLFGNQT